MARLTRRRFLSITAAAAALPGSALGATPVARWRGIALGADASLILAGLSQDAAKPVIGRAVAEIARLEAIFSLYRADSALSALNRDGRLDGPPPELLELLALSAGIHRQTEGAFDPTIQSLWALHAEAAIAGQTPSDGEVAAALAHTGWQFLRFDSSSVVLQRPGMAMTLNGIAQGYIADRIADLLRGAGLRGVLVDMGELHAIGTRADGRAWRAGIAALDGTLVGKPVPLVDRALATSAPRGTVLDPAGAIGHVLDPLTGRAGGRWVQVSVSAPRAALADGLSTAFCLMERRAIDRALAAYPDARVERLL